jgi:hypothetical protein
MRTDQLDLFAEQDAAEALVAAEEYRVNGWKTERHGAPLQPLFSDVDPYGPAVWAKVADEWVREFGNFGCLLRCHVWRVPGEGPGSMYGRTSADEMLGGRCFPAHMRLTAECDDPAHDRGRDVGEALRTGRGFVPRDVVASFPQWNADRCYCVQLDVSRGVCLGCGWTGPIRSRGEGGGHVAVEDAHDHAFPGWRELPVVLKRPEWGESKQARAAMQRWVEKIHEWYPADWLERGGPIRTDRGPIGSLGTRHVPGATGFGGYDLSATPIEEQLTPAQREEVAIYAQLIDEQWAFDRARRIAAKEAADAAARV